MKVGGSERREGDFLDGGLNSGKYTIYHYGDPIKPSTMCPSPIDIITNVLLQRYTLLMLYRNRIARLARMHRKEVFSIYALITLN